MVLPAAISGRIAADGPLTTGAHVVSLREPDPASAAATTADLVIGPMAVRFAAVLGFLDGRCGAARVLAADLDGDAPVLLASPPHGSPALDAVHLSEPGEVIRAFAGRLRDLHSLDPAGCPFAAGLDETLADATERVGAGLVDPDTFDDPNLDLEPAELLAHAVALVQLVRSRTGRPIPPVVVVHGGYRLETLRLDHGAAAGLTGVDRLGLGDPARDLASAARSLARHISPEVLPAFFAEYRLHEPDAVRLEAYALLDQLL